MKTKTPIRKLREDNWGSNERRRELLRERGWRPSVGVTVLTHQAHWIGPSCITMAEAEAYAMEIERNP